MFIVVDGFLIAVLLFFAGALGYSALNSMVGVASTIVTVIAVLLYVGVVIFAVYSLWVQIQSRHLIGAGNAFVNSLFSLLSSALALYMTHFCIGSFVGISINSVLDILVEVVVGGGFCIMFFFFNIGTWLWTQFDQDGNFNYLGLVCEIAVAIGTYWIFDVLRLV